jgi:hypothetical protein
VSQSTLRRLAPQLLPIPRDQLRASALPISGSQAARSVRPPHPPRRPSGTTQRTIGRPGARRGLPLAPGPPSGARPGGGQSPDTAGRTHPGRRRGNTAAAGRGLQLQSNRSDGGGRGAGTSVGSSRWVRILRVTTGSSMVANTRMRPPHRAQANTFTPNVWRISSGHDHFRGAGGEGSSTLPVWLGLDSPAWTTLARLGLLRSSGPGSRCDAPLASGMPADHARSAGRAELPCRIGPQSRDRLGRVCPGVLRWLAVVEPPSLTVPSHHLDLWPGEMRLAGPLPSPPRSRARGHLVALQPDLAGAALGL